MIVVLLIAFQPSAEFVDILTMIHHRTPVIVVTANIMLFGTIVVIIIVYHATINAPARISTRQHWISEGNIPTAFHIRRHDCHCFHFGR